MALLDARSSDAEAVSSALDREIEASLGGRAEHPEGTVFISHAHAHSQLVERYRRGGSPVGIVCEDGSVILRPASMSSADRITLALIAGALLWIALRGRPRVLN